MKKVESAAAAIAEAVKLCNVKVMPMYPITPSTLIPERLSEFVNNGEMEAEMIHVESEHSAASALIGSILCGARSFTATASQGLALMFEILPIISGLRLPAVMAVANRSLSAPLNIWNDHSDSVSARDQGWIQLYAESAQEALDTTIQAYKIAENGGVLLPVMVCIDGFTLSHVYENIDVPEQEKVNKFLPAYAPKYVLDVEKPLTFGPIVFPDAFMEFKKQQEEAMENSAKIISKVNDDFGKMFGRKYGNGLIETYRMNDAEHAIIGIGSLCTTARSVVDKLRKNKIKAGLIRIRCLRPFPKNEIQDISKKLKSLAVIDRHISLGFEGALATDVKSALSEIKIKPFIADFIAGLGGRDITEKHLEYAIKQTIGKKTGGWLL